MKIDHIGYAVKDIEQAIARFCLLGYQFEEMIVDADRNVRLAFGANDGYRIELVTPLDKKQPSPVDGYLRKVGSTAYHICYRSQRFEKDIAELQEKDFFMVVPPQPAVAFGGKRVVFLLHPDVGLMEIVEDETQEGNDVYAGT